MVELPQPPVELPRPRPESSVLSLSRRPPAPGPDDGLDAATRALVEEWRASTRELDRQLEKRGLSREKLARHAEKLAQNDPAVRAELDRCRREIQQFCGPIEPVAAPVLPKAPVRPVLPAGYRMIRG